MSRAEQFELLPDEVAQRWRKFGRSERIFYTQLLGIEVEEVRVDYCRMRLPFRPELQQPAGLVHGGALASLLDAVVVPAIGAVYEADVRFATVDMHVQFMSAVRDHDVVGEGWVTRRGRTTAFCEAEAVDAVTGATVARSMLTYNIANPAG
ncbi:MAG TPA: PaaI family thioesterase [Ilumatobacteraceae bacterium]|nr:PaaI family thioesterase [Ilumatobacteraceae bacterium]